MAIARGAGTEIIRSVLLEAVNSSERKLIIGVQHHIYTVLSVVCHAVSLGSEGDWIEMYILGYDANGGTTQENIILFKQNLSDKQTFVWNDKFSFNGAEPANFTGPMDDATKQDAIADQGSAPVAQVLFIDTQSGSDNIDVVCTYIDQNNA